MSNAAVRQGVLRVSRPRTFAGWVKLSAVALALLMLPFLWTYLPIQVGGATDYVVTDGTSMLPLFRADGVVLTRSLSHYEIGEVVAYHNRQLHTVVLHRIVGMDGARFILKGDNNNFRDSYHPSQQDLIGKEWKYLPGAGRFLRGVRNPYVFAAIAALLGLIAFSGVTPKSAHPEAVRHAS